MGAVGVSHAPHAPDAAAAPLQGQARAPLGSEAVGGRVAIHFTGVGVWCSGEVIAYDDVREVGAFYGSPVLTRMPSHLCFFLSLHSPLQATVLLSRDRQYEGRCVCKALLGMQPRMPTRGLTGQLTQAGMAAAQMHHVLYEDGEHEWVCLRKEAHCWAPPQPGPAYPAGLPPGPPLLRCPRLQCTRHSHAAPAWGALVARLHGLCSSLFC
jgi:hypothetical protein